jgi:hypothetical protein
VYTIAFPSDPTSCRTRQEYTSLKSSFEQALLSSIKNLQQHQCFVDGFCKIEKINVPNCSPEMTITFVLLFSEWGSDSVIENAATVAYQIHSAVSVGKFVMVVKEKPITPRESSFKLVEVQLQCKEGYTNSYKLCGKTKKNKSCRSYTYLEFCFHKNSQISLI